MRISIAMFKIPQNAVRCFSVREVLLMMPINQLEAKRKLRAAAQSRCKGSVYAMSMFMGKNKPLQSCLRQSRSYGGFRSPRACTPKAPRGKYLDGQNKAEG